MCLVGVGPVPCDVMLVGEAPGWREDDTRRPFAGRAGQMLDEVLAKVGLDRDHVFITNANKCRPPENRTPTKPEMKACSQYLIKEIARVQPKYILAMGNAALYATTRKSGIMKYRGEQLRMHRDVPAESDPIVVPTIHPAAVLRNPHWGSLLEADFGLFARLARGEDAKVPPPKTYLVRTKKTMQVMCRMILESDAVAYDLETNGFNEWAEGAAIATISISPRPGIAFVVPVHHPDTPWKSPERVLETLGNALIYTKAKRVAHNAKFDDRWLNHFGVPVHADFDTMIAAHLLEENRLKGLKPLSQILLGVDPWSIDVSDGQAMTHDLVKLARYNAKDTDHTLRLYYIFRTELEKPDNVRLLRLFVKLMMPASRALTDIERHGLWVDDKRLQQRRIRVGKKLTKLNQKLIDLVGHDANWNSPQQLAKILFDELQLPVIEETKKGARSTKESVLLRLAAQGYEVPTLIIEWRKWAKYQSTYLERWEEVKDERGRIHPNYKLTGTVTGRLSSGKEEGSRGPGLNVQQVPRDPLIRSILGAPPGWRFVEADFSQIELRIAAHYSGDPTLTRLFQLGEDPHMMMATKMTNKPAGQVTSEERKKAKSVNFGFLFGMGAPKFVSYAFDNYGVVVSEEEANVVRDTFFHSYPRLRPWHERQRRLVKGYKRVNSLIGRTRHLPDIDSHDEKVRGEAMRQAINSPVQSLASDMMLMALVILHRNMDPQEAAIVGTVHDSILFEIREDKVDHWTKIITETMENLPLKQKFGVTLDVPIAVDLKIGQHWSETS